ncbi:C1 family peptidase [Arthrobacter sp. Br18]|uniref:C1 family peptidase n=1 Tax=Arthrobacter sp. Br18 TaxID=1312954 RepID=UPI00047D7117|nr:C1 family peptidase [Arthrobacter sp. Br18]
MPKTLPPGVIELGVASFQVNVMPDVFDSRDLEYRPRLALLPAVLDRRPVDTLVQTQEGNSCTGHAMAAMINAVLSSAGAPVRVSPYMLYRMARRYDEFEGEEDEGSSLRGALKGWFYHGVLPTEDWPALTEDPDLDGDSALAEKAFLHPLGAFYRVNAHRLDDMQSAINELNVIVASALVHTGWIEPTRVVRSDGTNMHVIERPPGAGQLGGHAFTIVGYNSVGFLVQNSWGTDWGSGGFATLPYDDWLSSAYDAWVARPGVPAIVRTRNRAKVVDTTAGVLAEGPGPDLVRLSRHVVNLGNEGRLCTTGRFTSSPAQLERMFQRMEEYHHFWQGTSAGPDEAVHRVVLYAHGGLVDERSGLSTAQAQLNWWLNNQVYPISFAWQSGPVETMLNSFGDMIRGKLPFGGLGFDLVEQADRFVERFARQNIRWMWAEMKENAAAASAPLPPAVEWPRSGAGTDGWAGLPGASLLARRLGRYAESLGGGALEVHVVGHSAGSIFTAHLLSRLKEERVPVTSMTWLAPAIRIDDFQQLVLPHLKSGHVKKFASFSLRGAQELDDVVGTGKFNIYQKSLLYLVSHALEHGAEGRGGGEVPLFGMERFVDSPCDGSTLSRVLEAPSADLVFSPSQGPPASSSSATTHGGFDNDTATMTSVMVRILRLDEATERTRFQAHSPLLDAGPGAAREPAGNASAPSRVADVEHAGTAPVTRMAAPQPNDVQVPASAGPLPEEQLAPETTSPVMDALTRHGWTVESQAATSSALKAPGGIP